MRELLLIEVRVIYFSGQYIVYWFCCALFRWSGTDPKTYSLLFHYSFFLLFKKKQAALTCTYLSFFFLFHLV